MDSCESQDMKNPTNEGSTAAERPGFVYHLYAYLIIPLGILAFGVLGTIDIVYFSLVGSPSWRAAEFYDLVSLCLVGLYGVVFFWRQRWRTAVFYEDKFRITGRKTQLEIPYSELSVGAVTLVSKKDPNRDPDSIAIVVKGEDKPFLFPRKAKIRKVKTDSYLWMQDKIRKSERPTETTDTQ